MTDEENKEPILKVEVTNTPEPIKEKNPTSTDTEDEWDFDPTEEEQKEMTDAQ